MNPQERTSLVNPEKGNREIGLPDFQSHFRKLKLLLDEAFKEESSKILRDISINHLQPFISAIESGKKIRGVLCLMMTEWLGGTADSALFRAIAIELIQAATLIHDDFVDQDTLRRNRPATWTLEGSRRAVLIGDVIVATALKMMNELSRADGLAISRAIVEVSKGALDEPLEPLRLASDIDCKRIDRNAYTRIIHLKTAVLFGTACYLGALAANTNTELMDISYQYGLRIGEAYQMADDVKDLKAYLSRQSITPNQMVSSAPALLHFDGMRPQTIIDVLKGDGRRLTRSELDSLNRMIVLMEREIKQRISGAGSETEAFPNISRRYLLQSAPGEIIRMFNHQP